MTSPVDGTAVRQVLLTARPLDPAAVLEAVASASIQSHVDLLLAHCYVELGQNARAIEKLEGSPLVEVAKDDDLTWEGGYWLGRAYLGANRAAEAKPLFAKVKGCASTFRDVVQYG